MVPSWTLLHGGCPPLIPLASSFHGLQTTEAAGGAFDPTSSCLDAVWDVNRCPLRRECRLLLGLQKWLDGSSGARAADGAAVDGTNFRLRQM